MKKAVVFVGKVFITGIILAMVLGIGFMGPLKLDSLALSLVFSAIAGTLGGTLTRYIWEKKDEVI